MINVLFIANWWPNKDSPVNGIFIKEHAEAVSRFANITVVYINSIKKISSLFQFPYAIKSHTEKVNENLAIISLDIQIVSYRFNLIQLLTTSFLGKEIKLKKSNKFDLIHLNVLQGYFGKSAFKISGKFGLPLVLTEHHSFYHTEIYHLPKKEIVAKKKEIVTVLNNPNLKKILPVSDQLGNVLINDYSAPKDKIKKIANIANECFTSNNVKEVIEKVGRIHILAAALWQPPKNPILFFQIIKKLKKDNYLKYEKIKIFWGGDGIQMKEIKEYVERELSDLDIVYLGLLSKKEIANQMGLADFLVHPSDAENLPCIIIESICCGLPVLSVKINGVTELINNSNGKLYNVKDEIDFYNKFLEMIDHISQFDKYEIALAAREKYSANSIGLQISDIYNKVLKQV